MDFVCSRVAFIRAMRATMFGLSGHSAASPLGGVRLVAGAGRLILEATDLDRAVRCWIPFESSAANDDCVLDGAVLGRISSRLPEDEHIRLQSDDLQATVRITCGEASFELPTLRSDEFPDIGDLQGERIVDLRPAEFHRSLELTGFATFKPTETTRISLTGIDLDFRDEKLRMMGCNGHRLAVRTIDTDGMSREVETLVEARVLSDLDRALGQLGVQTVELRQSDGQLLVHAEDAIFMIRTIPEEFPSFERIIPQDHRVVLAFDRKGLLEALQRIAITASEESGAVRFQGVPGEAVAILRSASRDRGEAEERVRLQHAPPEHFEIAFRASYILDAGRRIVSPDIAFGIQSSDKACLIEPFGPHIAEADLGFVYVCMPVHMS